MARRSAQVQVRSRGNPGRDGHRNHGRRTQHIGIAASRPTLHQADEPPENHGPVIPPVGRLSSHVAAFPMAPQDMSRKCAACSVAHQGRSSPAGRRARAGRLPKPKPGTLAGVTCAAALQRLQVASQEPTALPPASGPWRCPAVAREPGHIGCGPRDSGQRRRGRWCDTQVRRLIVRLIFLLSRDRARPCHTGLQDAASDASSGDESHA